MGGGSGVCGVFWPAIPKVARREGLYEVDGELVSERTPRARWRAPCRSRLPRVRASWRWRCLRSLLTAAMFRHGTCEATRSVPARSNSSTANPTNRSSVLDDADHVFTMLVEIDLMTC